MMELKETNSDLPAREKMIRIGEMWKNKNHIEEEPNLLIH